MAHKSDLWRSRRDLAEAANGIRYDLHRMRTKPPNAPPSRWQNLGPSLGAAVVSTASYLLIKFYFVPPVGSLAIASQEDAVKLMAFSTTVGLLTRALLLHLSPTMPGFPRRLVLSMLAFGLMASASQIAGMSMYYNRSSAAVPAPAPKRDTPEVAGDTISPPVMGVAPAQPTQRLPENRTPASAALAALEPAALEPAALLEPAAAVINVPPDAIADPPVNDPPAKRQGQGQGRGPGN